MSIVDPNTKQQAQRHCALLTARAHSVPDSKKGENIKPSNDERDQYIEADYNDNN